MENYLQKTICTYNETAKEYAQNVKDICPMNELEKFVKMLPFYSKILDVGCGSGVASKILSDKGHNLFGIDLSRELLNEAKKQPPLANFYLQDMRNLGFKDNRFMGIWNVGSLLHLKKQDVSKALDETYRVLAPKGIMYLSVKSGTGEGLEEDKRYGGKPKWYSYFESEEINNLLEKSGFKILENYAIQYDDKYRIAHPWMNIFCERK